MKIKRIIFIAFLTVTFLCATFYYEQKKAEAVLPFIGYVAIAALIHFAVGAYIYMNSGGDTEVNEITAIDEATGQITIELASISGNLGIKSGNGITAYPKSMLITTYPEQTGYGGWAGTGNPDLDFELNANCFNHPDNPRFCAYEPYGGGYRTFRWDQTSNGPIFISGDAVNDTLTYNPSVGLGGSFEGSIDGNEVAIYDFIDDVPLLPDCFDGIQNQDETGIDCGGVCEINFGFVCPPAPETCFDGIQNQDETGVDCGGICELNYGLVCPAVETCSDGIMNQDETGVDFGGVCGTGNPVTPTPGNFIDNNLDGIEDITGLDASGNIPIAVPGTGDSSTYDASLPGDVSEFGETDWGTLITDFVSQNPLVLLATNSSINTSNESCLLTFSLWGKAMEIDFCSIEWMVNLFGTFVLGLMTIRSIFIAMGI